VVEVASGIDVHGIAIGKVADAVGKLLRVRHVGIADQQGDDRNVPGEGGLHFDPHVVGLGADPWLAMPLAAQPARSDDDHQHIAVLDARADVFAKVEPGRDVVDVAKHGLAAVTAGQPVEDATGDVHRVFTAIRDRDPGHALTADRMTA